MASVQAKYSLSVCYDWEAEPCDEFEQAQEMCNLPSIEVEEDD